MKQYTEYKDSGIEWIGEIPKGWNIGKLKYFTKVKDGTHDTPVYVDENEDNIPLITSKDIKDGNIYFEDAKYISYMDYIKINSRSDVTKYNVIMPMIGTVGNPAIVLTDKAFSIKNVALFKTENLTNAKYLQYLLNSDIVKQQFDLVNRGGVQQFVSLDILKNIYIIFNENLNEIVEYLDCKTIAIDNLIADKQKLIDLIKEKRLAVISEAVTKGLDKNTNMKESGIEWIGEIPDGWKTEKIKYNSYVKGRIGWQGLKAEEFIDVGPYLVTGTDFINGKINWDTCYHITEERYNEAPQIQLTEGDLLITKDGTIGKLAMVDEMPDKASLNSHLLVIRPLNNSYISKYLYFVFESEGFKKYTAMSQTGSIMNSLSQEKIENFIFPIPPLETQQQIIRYIENKTSAIDSLITDITEQIGKLKEFRQSIISEAVTGKVAI